jgi:asparagine synthase (glutamine-hydrolysing)
MCGIAGILSTRFDADELRSRVTAMQSRLRHRGPDDAGICIDSRARAGLAHTRLAIQDLSPCGHQPMSTPDGRYTIVFNGEIYNFMHLRRDLEKSGERFVSRTDTEVILKLYARDGEGCVRHFDGMYSFAIWDKRDGSCFLARGPFGIKPMYLWRHRESLAFASEMRALFEADLGPKTLCTLALHEYFLYGSVQDPRTLVDQIEVLPAGHKMLWKDGSGRRRRYWRLNFGADEYTRAEAIASTRQALDDSIRRHFVSDVPVGIFLSGGIDSTALVALARANGYENLKTLCISFDDPQHNEGDLAKETAAHFGTDHHDWRMTASDGRALLADFLDHVDQPSNDGFNTFCVSKMAHDEGLKVVLSGLGGDELFGGYRSFQLVPKLMNLHRWLGLTGPLRTLTGRIGENEAPQGRLRRFGSYLTTYGRVSEAYWAVRGFFTPNEAQQLVSFYTGGRDDFARNGCFGYDEMSQPTLSDDISYLEISRYMQNQLLRDSDVMSMAWGLELRVPYVDRKLVDQIGRVPSKLRIAPGKQLLLDAVPEIPEWIAHRPKRGFAFPFDQWISADWREIFEEIDRASPVRLATWYRRWALFTLNHFLRENSLESATDTMAQAMLTATTA